MSECEVKSLSHKLIKNLVDTLADVDVELSETEEKYKKLVELCKDITNRSCCTDCQCISCDIEEMLRELGEINV